MAVLFVCANNLKEAMYKIETTSKSKGYSPLGDENYLALPIGENEFYTFLHQIKPYLDQIDNGCADDFLFNLEIYGDEKLSTDRTKAYLNLSQILLNDKIINFLDDNDMYENYFFESDVKLERKHYIEFSVKFRDMCQYALNKNQTIFILGD